MKTLPISEAKARFAELVAAAEDREEEIVVTRNGRPAAILLSVDEYERLTATIETLADPEMMDQIAGSRAFFRTGEAPSSFDDVFDEPMVQEKPPRYRRR